MESGKYAVSAAGGQRCRCVERTGRITSSPLPGRHGAYESSMMVSISVRPERCSYQMIKESGAFVINLTTDELLCYATDYCGVRSGRDVISSKEMKLTKVEARRFPHR